MSKFAAFGREGAMAWASIAGVAATVGLIAVLVVWVVRSRVRDRRKARCLAQLSERYPGAMSCIAARPEGHGRRISGAD